MVTEKKYAEEYLDDKQQNFNEFLSDSSFVLKLISNTESEKEFKSVIARRYGIFLYTVSNDGILSMNFWSSQLILPPPETYADGDFEKFMDLLNGHYLVIKRSVQINEHTVVAYALIPVQSDFFLIRTICPNISFLAIRLISG